MNKHFKSIKNKNFKVVYAKKLNVNKTNALVSIKVYFATVSFVNVSIARILIVTNHNKHHIKSKQKLLKVVVIVFRDAKIIIVNALIII